MNRRVVVVAFWRAKGLDTSSGRSSVHCMPRSVDEYAYIRLEARLETRYEALLSIRVYGIDSHDGGCPVLHRMQTMVTSR